MRQVRLLTQALTRILFLKQNGRLDEALVEVESAGKLVGARSGIPLTRLDPEEIVSLASTKDRLHVDSALTIFELLVQATDLYEMEERYDDRDASALRAVHLALAIVSTDSDVGSVDLPPRIERMVRLCDVRQLNSPMLWQLMTFYEEQGQYGRAEDMLFVLTERGEPEVLSFGLALFDRLERVTPSRLRKGNLSLKEVAEGRRQLQQMIAKGAHSGAV